MATLYLIGGISKCGKTTLAVELAKRTSTIPVQSDAVRVGIRNMITGNSATGIEKVSLSGSVDFTVLPQDPAGEYLKEHKDFAYETDEDELTWKAVRGMIDYYDAKNVSIVVEGIHITPKRVAALHLRNLSVRAVFLGFTNPYHVHQIIAQSKLAKTDWVWRNIVSHGMSEEWMLNWGKEKAAASHEIKDESERYGYHYLDANDHGQQELTDEGLRMLLAL